MNDRDDGEGGKPGDKTQHDGTAQTLLQAGVARPPADGIDPALAAPLGSSRRLSPIVDVGARYTLGEVLGQGGMGEIVLAFDQQVGRDVAVKRIRAERPSAEELARFVREARVQGRLEHPAVVPVHDIAIDRTGKPFFVMKRLAGTEMKDVLTRLSDGTDPDEAATRRRLLRAFADVCLAIEFAHSRGIVHRDLKPANIMLGEYGEVYVLDWGIARTVGEVASSERAIEQGDLALATGETRAGAVLGTPAYMAPEQLVGDAAGPAADIYALGCILYEIAAGVPLHGHARSIGDIASPADSKPTMRRADAPPELDAICERATASEPEHRFDSARALGSAVQAYLDGDRDVEARKELARSHVAEARAALARGDDEQNRRAAMRAAGRALALDPTATDAADLVTRLMLEPPRRVPADVEERLEQIDIATGRNQGRIGAIAMTGYLWFIPLLMWTGVREWPLIVAFAACSLVSAAQIYAMTRKNRIPHAAIYINACINAVLMGLVCRIVGPFIIAPTIVLTTLMAYAVHPRFGRVGIVAAILTSGVALPWLLELVGTLEPTYQFQAGSLVLFSPVIELSAMPVQLAFAVLLVLNAAIVAVLLRSMATRQREVTKQIELHAWHLRQVLPATGP